MIGQQQESEDIHSFVSFKGDAYLCSALKQRFEFILALLPKMHATHPQMSYKECVVLAKCPIMSFLIVPHQDLAYQLMHWICMLCPHNLQSLLDSVAQVCICGNAVSLLDVQIKRCGWRVLISLSVYH